MASRYRPTPNSIRRLRETRGLSSRALAQRTGVAQSQIVRWENGQQGLLLESALLLARALDVPVADLLAPPPEQPNSIRALREAQGLTEVALAERAGVDQAQVSAWETGRVRLTLSNAAALAAALAVSVEALAAPPPQPVAPA